jgi:phospholipid transport system substrate-binding protein|tara:strand:+ start:1710 stop:2306 length:597 start_codon:yes stop_codon:yes gene_type:complete
MILKKKISFFFIIIIFFCHIESSFSIGPDVFVQSTVNRASEVLGGNHTIKEKISKLEIIAKETVDIVALSHYTLGSHRKNLTNSQKKEYARLFEKYFLKTFSDRLAQYTNPEVQVKSSKKLNENYTIVSSILVETKERPEVKIDWRIYTKNPENLLIRDLIIEGLSLARTQKEEFNSIIQTNKGDINALFNTLRKFTN